MKSLLVLHRPNIINEKIATHIQRSWPAAAASAVGTATTIEYNNFNWPICKSYDMLPATMQSFDVIAQFNSTNMSISHTA